MLKIVICTVVLIIFWILGYAHCYVFSKRDLVGNLLIVEQEHEEPVFLLEINKGKREEIRPGKIVQLSVEVYEREEN